METEAVDLIVILAAIAAGLALIGLIVWRTARSADRRDMAWRARGSAGSRVRSIGGAAAGLDANAYGASAMGGGAGDAGCGAGGGDGGGCN